MSRYPRTKGMHYIGGVDQFDVLWSDETFSYIIVWGHSLMERRMIGHMMIENPASIVRHLHHWDCFIAPEQAERIVLLVKLFGPGPVIRDI